MKKSANSKSNLRQKSLDDFIFFGRRNIAGYVTENEGNRCARERAFNVKIAPADSIK